jgi:curved DNA-binding protein CbpA
MSDTKFQDFYEDLTISRNADQETIERVYRLLAKRYHPDNKRTGSIERFDAITKAYKTLTIPEKRAAYDLNYEKEKSHQLKSLSGASAQRSFESDQLLRYTILSLLYIERRNDPSNCAIGILRLEQLLGWPEKILEFHMWYLKEKKYIQRSDDGGYVISAEGIDVIEENNVMINKDRLLPHHKNFASSEILNKESLLDNKVQ